MLLLSLCVFTFLKYTISVQSQPPIQMQPYIWRNQFLLSLRNKMLKTLLALDYRKYKNKFLAFRDKSADIYKLCFTKLCVSSCEYESLAEDEKMFIETIVSLYL